MSAPPPIPKPRRLQGRKLARGASAVAMAWMLLVLGCLVHGYGTGEFLSFLPTGQRAPLEACLGLAPHTADATRSWRIQPGVDATVLAVLCLGGLATPFLMRRYGGVDPRGVALLFLFLGLLPMWSLSLRLQEWGTLVIVVDTSQSMKTIETQEAVTHSRAEVLQQMLLSATVESLRQQHVIRLYTLGEQSRLIGTFSPRQRDAWHAAVRSLQPQETQSMLGDGLRHILENEQPTALLLCTDGLVTSGIRLQEAALGARSRRVPLFLLGVGKAASPGRVRIKAVRMSHQVQVRDVLAVEADVCAEGFPPGRGQVRVQLSLWDNEQAQPVERHEVLLDAQGTMRTVRFRHQPMVAGERTYQVRIDEPVPGSHMERVVRVLPAREIHVLLLDSQPRPETRFLSALWGRQTTQVPNQGAVHVRTRLIDLEAEEDAVESLPPRTLGRLDLTGVDVVVLGDVDPRHVSLAEQNALKDFVQRQGGSLIFLAGPRFLPEAWTQTLLHELLPVERQIRLATPNKEPGWPYQVLWTDRRHPLLRPLFLSGEPFLTPMTWVASGWQAKPAAETLAQAVPTAAPLSLMRPGTMPLLVVARSGKGRSLYVGTDETWRWRALGGNDWYERFWWQVLRSLSEEPEQHAVLHCAQPMPLRQGEPLRIEAHFSSEVGTAVNPERILQVEWQPVRVNGGATAEMETRTVPLQDMPDRPGSAFWEEKSARPGKYRVRLLSPQIKPVPVLEVTVAPPPAEQTMAAADLEGMQAAARAAEGHFLAWHDVDRLPAHLPSGPTLGLGAPVAVPLWNHPVFYLPLLLFLVVEWWRQRWMEGG